MPPKPSQPNSSLALTDAKPSYLINQKRYRTRVFDSWSQLKVILEKNLKSRPTHEQSNNIYWIKQILTKINAWNLDKEEIGRLRTMLDELSELTTKLAPSMRSKIVGNNPRHDIKNLLEKNQDGAMLRQDIDPKITAYIATQRLALTNEIGYRNAGQQVGYLQRIQGKYPEDTMELLLLKRHEVSSKTHKGAGFNPDTGLDALHFPFSSQTLFDLESIQKVQTMQLLYMKAMGAVGHVEEMVSPLQRTYETALHATFELDNLDTLFISSVFAEKQHTLPLIGFSARASKKPSEVAALFLSPLECKEAKLLENKAATPLDRPKLSYADDVLLNYEYPWKFQERLSQAYAYTMAPFLHNPGDDCPSLRILIAHGGLNKALLKYIKKTNQDIATSLPEHPDHLDFGSQYQFILIRDKNKKIKAIEYLGIYGRLGAVQIPTSRPVMLEDRLAKLLMHIDSRRIDGVSLDDGHLARILFKYCTLEPAASKVKLKILEKNHATIMLDHLPFLPLKNLEQSQFIIETLLQFEHERLNNKLIKQKKASALTLWGIAAVHQVTGKDYTKQIYTLNRLKKENEFVDIPALNELLETAKTTFTAGKVINLIEAVLKLQEGKKFLQEEVQRNAPS